MSFSIARVTAAIDAAVDDTTHIQLHDGDPGPNGTDNVAASVDREGLVFPAATSGSTAQTATFTIPGAGGPFTHVSGWNDTSAGTFQWSAELTPAESFAGPGALEVTVTATAANAS